MGIRVRVLYFGSARDAAGTREEEVTLSKGATVGSLVSQSTESHAELERLCEGMRFSVNEEIASRDQGLHEGDVVAFLPPVAGG